MSVYEMIRILSLMVSLDFEGFTLSSSFHCRLLALTIVLLSDGSSIPGVASTGPCL